MKTFWKVVGWVVLGLIGLFVIFGVAALFFSRRFLTYGGMMTFDDRVAPFGFRNGMHGYPMMVHPGFNYGFPFLGWLIPLGLFVLLVLGGIGIFLSLRRPSVSTVSPAPAVVAAAAPVTTVEPTATVAEAAMPGKTCSNCGKPVQADWVTCPYCSHSLTETA